MHLNDLIITLLDLDHYLATSLRYVRLPPCVLFLPSPLFFTNSSGSFRSLLSVEAGFNPTLLLDMALSVIEGLPSSAVFQSMAIAILAYVLRFLQDV